MSLGHSHATHGGLSSFKCVCAFAILLYTCSLLLFFPFAKKYGGLSEAGKKKKTAVAGSSVETTAASKRDILRSAELSATSSKANTYTRTFGALEEGGIYNSQFCAATTRVSSIKALHTHTHTHHPSTRVERAQLRVWAFDKTPAEICELISIAKLSGLITKLE